MNRILRNPVSGAFDPLSSPGPRRPNHRQILEAKARSARAQEHAGAASAASEAWTTLPPGASIGEVVRSLTDQRIRIPCRKSWVRGR